MTLNSIKIKDIRKFGLIALIFFGILSALGLWKQKPIPIYLFGGLSLLGLCFILIPNKLKPVYILWLKVAHFIGRVVTTFVLALAYYLVITPFALLKRIFGGTPLPLKPDKNADSYWITRREPVQPKERFVKRY